MASWVTSEVNIAYTFYTPTNQIDVARQSGSESAYSYTINWYIPSQTVNFSTKYNGAQDVNGSYWGSVSLSNILLPDSDLNFFMKPVTNTYGNYETGLLKVDVKQSSTTPSDPDYKDLTFYLDGEISSSNLSGTWNLHIGSGYGIKIVFVQTSAKAQIKFNCAYGNKTVEYTEYNAIALPRINDVYYLYMGPMYLAYDTINHYQEGLVTFWLVGSNGLWYLTLAENKVFRTQLSSSLITIDTVVYGTVSSTLYYRNYTDDTNYTIIELGTKQVGSQYTMPANSSAGSKEHYNFQTWRYYGRNYQGGDTFYSQPPDFNTNTGLLVESIWTGKDYTITFDINEQGTSPSSVDPITAEYGTSVSIPSLSLTNYDFKGWISSLDSEVYTTTYTIKGTDTLTSRFEPKIYTVKFYDVGQTDPLFTSSPTPYPNTVNVPTTTLQQGIALNGWKLKGGQRIIIEPNDTVFQPSSEYADLNQNVELERVYVYSLVLYRKDSATSEVSLETYSNIPYPNRKDLPQSSGSVPAGYDLKGWTDESYVYSKDIAKTGVYSFTPAYTVVNNTIVLQPIPKYYMALTPKELISLAIKYQDADTESITLVKGDSASVRVVVNPSDWLGTVEWVAQAQEQQAGIYIELSPNDRNATVTALEPTNDDVLTLTAQGPKRTWESTGELKTDSIRIRIFDYVPISFFTKNELGMEIPYNNNTYRDGGEETNTFFTSQDVETSEWEWIEGPCTKLFPSNPTRTGYVFTGWVDADGNLIDFDHPPQNPINVYATWAGTYVDNDRDSLYLQLFNFDGNRMMKQHDMGIIQSNTETFNTGVSAQPTPTMTSVNTFITNLNCTESISIKITRKSPEIVRDANNRILNDDSDDPLVWTNRKWLLEMRGLVDRWQSATDGIKLLYIPRGMKVIKILDQYAGIGDNYDLLGYVKEFSDDSDANNSGLLFEQDGKRYVLVGYNGIISSYSDNYMATYRRVAEVSITFKLGGMKSKYQNWKDALVLLR